MSLSSHPLPHPLAAFAEAVGTGCVSRWFTVDQARIDAFAEVCEDWQDIHLDPESLGANRFGATVAHGFLTLSMLSAMGYDAQPPIEGVAFSVNYGFERIRFLSPVRSGSRVRGRFVLASLEERSPGEATLTWDVTVEIEGAEKPALVARWITRRYLST